MNRRGAFYASSKVPFCGETAHPPAGLSAIFGAESAPQYPSWSVLRSLFEPAGRPSNYSMSIAYTIGVV
jgi:hypothetical protein